MAEATTDAHEELKKARADQIKNNEEKMAFDARQRPTPTPDEMVAAYAGKNADEKEPSGAVPQNMNDPLGHLDPHKRKPEERTKKAATAAEGHDAPYQTRASSAKEHK